MVINKNSGRRFFFLFERNGLFYCAEEEGRMTANVKGEASFMVFGFPLESIGPVSKRVVKQITLKDAEKLLSTDKEQVQIVAFNL